MLFVLIYFLRRFPLMDALEQINRQYVNDLISKNKLVMEDVSSTLANFGNKFSAIDLQ